MDGTPGLVPNYHALAVNFKSVISVIAAANNGTTHKGTEELPCLSVPQFDGSISGACGGICCSPI